MILLLLTVDISRLHSAEMCFWGEYIMIVEDTEQGIKW